MNMVQVKVSELTGAALDYAVAMCEGAEGARLHTFKILDPVPPAWVIDWSQGWVALVDYSPSTDWSQGGPIIEGEGIHLSQSFGGPDGSFAVPTGWLAYRYERGGVINPPRFRGPTPLIAAMRCYVASKKGETVMVPAELVGGAS